MRVGQVGLPALREGYEKVLRDFAPPERHHMLCRHVHTRDCTHHGGIFVCCVLMPGNPNRPHRGE